MNENYDNPVVSEAHKAIVKKRLQDIDDALSYFKKDYERMARDIRWARGEQWDGMHDGGYVANITLRHIEQKTAVLYAKDPSIVAQRRKRWRSQYWDGSLTSYNEAKMTVAQAQQMGMQPPAEAAQIVLEAGAELRDRAMLERIGDAVKEIIRYSMTAGAPPFKTTAKQAVRRALITGVAYCEIGYRTSGDVPADRTVRTGDSVERALSIGVEMERENADEEEKAGLVDAMMSGFEEQGDWIEPDGLTFSWPLAQDVIPDPATISLIGWQGTRWVAVRYTLTKDEVQAIYGVCVTGGKKNTVRGPDRMPDQSIKRGPEKDTVCVYKVYDKRRGTVEIVCDGYEGYLEEPRAPSVRVDGFFPIYALTLHEVENERSPFPPSEVSLMRDAQADYNTARQGLREHRIANRPGMAYADGKLEQGEIDRLRNRRAHDVIPIKAVGEELVERLITPLPNVPITQSLYDTNPQTSDIMLSVGSQEANLGATSGATATESSIAEVSRQTATGSQVDDIDAWLSAIVRGMSQVLLMNMPLQRARQIAGPAVSWPAGMAWQEILQDLQFNIRAGSSGKPNRATQLAMIERVGGLLSQIPGFNMEGLARMVAELLDDTTAVDDLLSPGAPSIVALNSMAGLSPGQGINAINSAGAAAGINNPSMQGFQGVANSPQPAAQGPQPMAGPMMSF